MPVSPLPPNPDLGQLSDQAQALLYAEPRDARATAQRIREFHPRFVHASDREILAQPLSMADAQLIIARQHGFHSWERLKRHIETPSLADRLDLPHHQRIESIQFREAVKLLDHGDLGGLRALLLQYPHLVHERIDLEGANWFTHPSLLEFVAENPVRHGRLAANILGVTQTILDAGPDQGAKDDTLALVATGSVVHKEGMQTALIEMLVEAGANPNVASHAAALHNDDLQALATLIRLGATIDLPLAAALGHATQFDALLPAASAAQRHLALVLAVQHGRLAQVQQLLDLGEDPNRYNPVGGHAHATLLHHAVASRQPQIVQLLLERGASPQARDLMWHDTPAGWARYTGQTELEQRLLSIQMQAPAD